MPPAGGRPRFWQDPARADRPKPGDAERRWTTRFPRESPAPRKTGACGGKDPEALRGVTEVTSVFDPFPLKNAQETYQDLDRTDWTNVTAAPARPPFT